MENQVELQTEIHRLWSRYKTLNPELVKAYADLPAQAYGDGAIDGKTKRLMAMTAAVVHGCRACILYQADQALELGATAQEMLECVGVAVSLGGTMAEGEATRLIRFMEEKGLI